MTLDKDFEDFVTLLNKHEVNYGIPVNYIGLDDLIKNKQVSGRHRDISDIIELNKLKNKL